MMYQPSEMNSRKNPFNMSSSSFKDIFEDPDITISTDLNEEYFKLK